MAETKALDLTEKLHATQVACCDAGVRSIAAQLGQAGLSGLASGIEQLLRIHELVQEVEGAPFAPAEKPNLRAVE